MSNHALNIFSIRACLVLAVVVVTAGCSSNNNNTPTTPVMTFAQIVAGDDHTCVLTSSGRLYCWGRHNKGQLGLGNTDGDDEDMDPDDILQPTLVGTATNWSALSGGVDHTCAVNTDGALFCWGDNGDGQLGLGNTDDQDTPQRVGSESNWSTVATGEKHTCAINTAGALFCWGEGQDGKLGQGAADLMSYDTPRAVGTQTDWSAVYAGEDHTCAISGTDKALSCWGKNNDGELGLGNLIDQSSPQKIAGLSAWNRVAVGFEHSCASNDSGQLYCWGENNDNELGLGNQDNQETPMRVGTESNWSSVAAGGNHSCATTATGQLHCWGRNDFGQLGNGNTDPEAQTLTPARVGTATNWALVDAGNDHTCASTVSNELYCWGEGANGRLGLGDAEQKNTPQRIVFAFE